MRQEFRIAAVGAITMMLSACGGGAGNEVAANNVAAENNMAAATSVTGLGGPWPGGLPAYSGGTLRRGGGASQAGCEGFFIDTTDPLEQVISFYRAALEGAGFSDPMAGSTSVSLRRGEGGPLVRMAGVGLSGNMRTVGVEVCERG